MKLQDLVFTDGLATIRAQEFLLCITANSDMTYTIKKYSNNKTDVIAALASASRVQDALDYYFPEPTQSHQPTPQTPENGLNLSQSDGSTASYYELPEGATELQHLISHRDMNAQIGEIFRSCYRYGLVSHSDKLRDAKKMRFYAQAEVERLEAIDEMAFKHTLGGE